MPRILDDEFASQPDPFGLYGPASGSSETPKPSVTQEMRKPERPASEQPVLGISTSEFDARFSGGEPKGPAAKIEQGAKAEPEQESAPQFNVSPQDWNDAVDTIIAEAAGEGFDGMAGVANVIKNRSMLSGKSIGDIVRAPDQFTGYSAPGKDVQKAQQDPEMRAQAEAALAGVMGGKIQDFTGGADHYHAKSVNPYWAKSMQSTTDVGAHRYYASDKARKKSAAEQSFDQILNQSAGSEEQPQEEDTRRGLARLVPQEKPNTEGAGTLKFVNAGQDRIDPVFRNILTGVSEELGHGLTITSGFRGANHPVERAKKQPGEHSKGTAGDISMRGMNEQQRLDLVMRLHGRGARRFIVYPNSPDMLHVDLKDQTGKGTPWFMFNRSNRNMHQAPRWFQTAQKLAMSGKVEQGKPQTVGADFNAPDPMGLYGSQTSKPASNSPVDKPTQLYTDKINELAVAKQTPASPDKNAPADPLDARVSQLNTEEPDTYAAMTQTEYDKWKGEFDANQPYFVTDVARMLAGGAVTGTASIIQGIGRLDGAFNAMVLNPIFGTDFYEGNKNEVPAEWVKKYGESIKSGVSQATKDAIEGSNPSGDILKPSTWSFGENPSALGLVALGADVFGAMLPVVAAGATTGGLGAIITGGAQGAGGAEDRAVQVIEDLAKTPGALEKQSAYFREQVASGKTRAEAIKATKDAASNLAAVYAAPVAGVGGLFTSKLAHPATQIFANRGVAASVGGRAAVGAIEEGSQEALETVAGNTGINQAVGTDIDVTDGTFGDFVLGALAGGTMGAGGGALAAARKRGNGAEANSADPVTTDLTEEPTQQEAAAPTDGSAELPAYERAAPRAGSIADSVAKAARRTQLEYVVNDGPIDGMPAGELHGSKVLISGNQDGLSPNFTRIITPQGNERIIGNNLLVPLSEAEGITPVTEGGEPTNQPPENAPKFGENVTVNVEGMPPFRGKIDGYYDGDAMVIDTDSGEVLQVPVSSIQPDTGQQSTETLPERDMGDLESVPPSQPVASETHSEGLPADEDLKPLSMPGTQVKAGDRVIVDHPQLGKFVSRVEALADDGEAQEAVVKDSNGNDVQVPFANLKVDATSKEDIERENIKRDPPVEREAVDMSQPHNRSIGGRAITLPDDTSSRLYDLGRERFMSKQLSGASNLDMDEATVSADHKKLADELGVTPRDLGRLADHYRFQIERFTRDGKSKGNLPIKMPPVQTDVLNRLRKERDKAEAAARGAEGEPNWYDGLTEVQRSEVLAAAGVKRSPKHTWDSLTPPIRQKLEEARAKRDDSFSGQPLPNAGVAPANMGSDGKVYVGRAGGVHFEIERPEGVEWKDVGFVNPKGDFLNRKQALDWVNKNEKAVKPSDNMDGELDAIDYREQVPANERSSSKASLEVAAQDAATSPTNSRPQPTAAQQEAGNYAKGHVRLGGLDISIENPAGSERKGTDGDGKPWSITMRSHYGYFRGTKGKDKDHIDTFIKKGTENLDDSAPVYVVDQKDSKTGRFDEHKVMVGFPDADSARAGYLENYTKGWKGLGDITETTLGDFKRWLKNSDTTKPFAPKWFSSLDKADAYVSKNSLSRTHIVVPNGKRFEIRSRDMAGRGETALKPTPDIKQFDMSTPEGRAAYTSASPYYDVWASDTDAINDALDKLASTTNGGDADIVNAVRSGADNKTLLETAARVFGESGSGGNKYMVEARKGPTVKVTLEKDGGNKPVILRGKELADALRSNFTETLDEMRQKQEAKQPLPAKPKEKQEEPKQFADNKLFKAAAVEAARARLKTKLSQLNSGLDPEIMMDGLVITGAYIESGIRDFSKFSKAMLDDFGEKVKPFLLSFWEGARHYPGLDNDGMTSPEASAAAHKSIMNNNPELRNTNYGTVADTGETALELVEKKKTEKPDNESGKLEVDGAGALEGTPAAPVRGSSESRDAGRSPSVRSGSDKSGNRAAATERSDIRGGVADGPDGISNAERGKDTADADGQRQTNDTGTVGERKRTRSRTDEPRLNLDEPAPRAEASGTAVTPAHDLPDNFTITDADEIGAGGAKTKFKNNIAAIRLLRTLDAEKRPATRSEQAVLAKWVGWGGLQAAFNREDGSVSKEWTREAAELKALLTPEEYRAAQASTRNAHFTSPEIVSAIWSIVDQLGFRGGRVLEPSVGSGNFLGLTPAKFRSTTKFTGVELDHITGGIAKNIYPASNIQAPIGFQDVVIPNNYFDLAIGNPPFGSERLYDKSRRELKDMSIHNFFFAKSIDTLRPNGVLAMVITNSFLDAANANARRYIAERADLVAAIRLPNNAFAKNANTEVTTDIIVLRKRAEGEAAAPVNWLNVGRITDKEGRSTPLNEYFVQNPDMMLGDFGMYGSMYGPDMPALIARSGDNVSELLKGIVAKLPKGVITDTVIEVEPESVSVPVDVADVPVGSLFLDPEGQLFTRSPDHIGETRARKTEFANDRAKERASGMVRIRDTFAKLRRAQISEGSTESQIDNLRSQLNKQYDAFVSKNGPINLQANRLVFGDDPTWPQISALEDGFDKGVSNSIAKKTGEVERAPSARKTPIFSKRTQFPYQRPTRADTAKDALALVLSERGRIDTDEMSALTGKDRAKLLEELGSLVYETPAGELLPADLYLSGNVKRKLALAEDAAKNDPKFKRNVAALRDVIPADIEAVDIKIRAGSPWVPGKHVADFVDHITGGRGSSAIYSATNAKWTLQPARPSTASETQWGTGRASVREIVGAAINGNTLTIYDRHHDGTATVNQQETEAANTKVESVKSEWQRWIWQDDARRDLLARIYNDVFNTNVETVYDGSHLQLPGKVGDDIISLRPHQKSFVWRVLQSSTTLADHTVGAGKTFAAIAAVMELRRTGMARKPMMVVPNHLVGQWAADFVKLYPNAKVLAATKKDFEKGNRKRLFARVATGDWDAVVVAHSSFSRIGVDPMFEADFIQQQLEDIETAMADLRAAEGKDTRNVKQLSKWRDNMQSKLKKLLDAGAKDEGMTFEEMGVDGIFVDEAHEFKNLAFATSMSRVAGLGNPTGSQKAADLFMKIQSVKKRTGGRNIVFLTGTPISNTMAEMFTMQRYLDYSGLQARGIAHFDAWARVFGEVVTDWELSPAGQYKMKSRFSKFVNIPELIQSYRSFADVITNEDIKRQLAAIGKKLPLPRVKGGKPQNIVVQPSENQLGYIGEAVIDANGDSSFPEGTLVWRAENLPKKAEKGSDNMLKIMSDARKAALDMRMINPNLPDEKGSKVHIAADQMLRIYDRWHAKKGTQLVFIDLSTPKGNVSKAKLELEELVRKAEDGDETAQEAVNAMSPDELLALDSNDFSVYDDLKQKLIDRGVPEKQIAFIHDANTDQQKEELFSKVRAGTVRFLFGSTPKMGAGTNVQNRLVGLHHLDAPWRPSDIEQRDGRGIRQGNELYNEDPDRFEIEILRYATEKTLDARQWQTIEQKARFIEQLRRGDSKQREIEDIGGEAANAAEMKAAASGNPLILEEMDLRQKVRKLDSAASEHDRNQFRVKSRLRAAREEIDEINADMPDMLSEAKQAETMLKADFSATVDGKRIEKQSEMGEAIAQVGREMLQSNQSSRSIGSFGTYKLKLDHLHSKAFALQLNGVREHEVLIDDVEAVSTVGLGQRVSNTVRRLVDAPDFAKERMQEVKKQIPALEKQIAPWGDAEALRQAQERHQQVLNELKPKPRASAPTQEVENSQAKNSVVDGESAPAKSVIAELSGSKFGKLADSLMKDGKLKIVSQDQAPAASVQAWTDPDGTINLVEGAIPAGNVESVLLHEAFHNVRPLIGSSAWVSLTKRLGGLYEQAKNSRGAARRFYDAARERVANAQEQTGDLSRDLTIEEFGAYTVEEYSAAPAAFGTWAKEAIGAIKAWALRRFGLQVGKVSSEQLRALAVAALSSTAVPTSTPARFNVSAAAVSRNASNFTEARTAAKAFQGKAMTNEASGLEAMVSRNTLDKMLSSKAVSKSESAEAHSLAVANLDQLFARAVHGWSKPDAGGDSNIVAIHRLFAPMMKDGKALIAKLTVKETAQQDRSNPLYTVEAVELNEISPAAQWVGEIANADGIDPRTIRSAGDVLNIAQQVEKFNAKPNQNEKRFSISPKASALAVVEQIKGASIDVQPTLLKAVPLNYFEELAQANMKAIPEYLRVKRNLDAYRGKKHAKAAETAQQWLKFTRLGKDKVSALAELMHSSTLAGVDPSLPEDVYAQLMKDQGKKQKPEYASLRKQFNALPNEGKALFERVRDDYAAQAEELDNILLDNVKKAYKVAEYRAEKRFTKELQRVSKADMNPVQRKEAEEAAIKAHRAEMTRAKLTMKARLTKMRLAFESSRVDGVYFPLARSGRYFVTVRNKEGEVLSFSRRDKAVERDRLASALKDDFPGASIEVGVMENNEALRKAMDPRLVAEMESVLTEAAIPSDIRNDVLDQLWQRYLETMPDLSTRKRYIHRKGTAGFDSDALRSYSSHMFHAAHQMGKLRYGIELNELVNIAVDQGRDAKDPTKGMTLANELKSRHQWVMNPTGKKLVQHATSAAFVWYLAATPAAALVNITQTPMMGIPILGARLGGMGKAAAALAKASSDVLIRGGGRAERSSALNESERNALAAFYDSGLIDRTQSHDLAGVGETGVEYSPLWAKFMEKISWAFHNAEVLNREVTALAAFRMAKERGMRDDQAIDMAHSLTWKTHFDYSNSSRPTIMQGDTAKLLFVFRSHNVNMIYRVTRDIHQALKGETAQAKSEARSQLAGVFGMMALMGGVTGVFGYNLAMTILGAVFGDDDDPFTFEEKFKKGMVDTLGPNLAGMALNGAIGHFAGINLTSRIGMADIWFRSPTRELKAKEEYNNFILDSLGATVSMGRDWWTGAQSVLGGDAYRGIETMSPKVLKDLMKAYRYMSEGVVSGRGDEVLPADAISSWDVIAQAMGFAPAKVAETWERNSSLKNAERRIKDRRQELMNRYSLAVNAGDAEARAKVIKQIQHFNSVPINKPMAITGKTLTQSQKAKTKNRKKREDGVLIQNKRLGKELRLGLPDLMYR